MYPFRGRLKWWMANRQMHLVEAIRACPAIIDGPNERVVRARLKQLQVWLKVRLAFLVLLNFSIIALVVAAILAVTGDPTGVLAPTMAKVRSITSFSSGGLALGFFAAMRTIGQIEIDLIALAALPVSTQGHVD